MTNNIEIGFENKSITSSYSTTVGSWLTHPAFISFNSNVFWARKFESGYKRVTTTISAQLNLSNSNKLPIKPNTYVVIVKISV